MNPPTGRSDLRVELEPVDEEEKGFGLEIHVAIQSKEKSVLGAHHLAGVRDVLAEQCVCKEVVHVHDLQGREGNIRLRVNKQFKKTSIQRKDDLDDTVV
jgi:citrate lyase gamma subunit